MTNIILVIILANVTIYVFYRFFETVWPTSYFTENDKTGLVISVTPFRFLLFRLLPVFLITFLFLRVFKICEISQNIGLIGVISTFLHITTTNLVSIIKIITNDKTVKTYFNKTNQIVYHTLTIIGVTFIGYLSGILSKYDYFDHYLPTKQGLIDNIWSSIIYGVFFIGFWKFYISRREKSIESILEKSILQIRRNKEISGAIQEFSKKNNSMIQLVEAICVVENIQRPKWFRNIERLLPRASYGIMQVNSKKRISDKDSVSIATNKYLQKTENIKNMQELEGTLLKYNNNNDFVELVEKTLEQIDSSLFCLLARGSNN